MTTMLVTDHPHLFETGGENYHTEFTAWEYLRGHETDPWKTRPDPSWVGAPSFGRAYPYDRSRGWFRDESDFPGPRTMAAAAAWLDDAARHHDRFFLLIDEFDPHEPFDTPEPYASMYDPDWHDPHLIWPPYAAGAVGRGIISPAEGRQIRARYGAKLTMIDAWFGRLLDVMDRREMWGDTIVMVCTDHGHYLGEKDVWGKPAVPLYEQMAHIPLLVRWPGVAAGEVDALTTAVDLFATVADVFDVEPHYRTHGHSLRPLLTGAATSIREWALAGVWGREVHVVDGDRKYARAPAGSNSPLSMWSNRWSTMPVAGVPALRLPDPDGRARLDRMPGSAIPVIRQPFVAGDLLPYWAGRKFSGNHLYDLRADPDEEENRLGGRDEKEMEELLRVALRAVEAPPDHFERLGLN